MLSYIIRRLLLIIPTLLGILLINFIYNNISLTTSQEALADINNDGTVNILDIIATVNIVLGGEFNSDADLNGDYNVDILDVILIVNILLG